MNLYETEKSLLEDFHSEKRLSAFSFKELGIDVPEPDASTRASDEGQVSADITFDDFLKVLKTPPSDKKISVFHFGSSLMFHTYIFQ